MRLARAYLYYNAHAQLLRWNRLNGGKVYAACCMSVTPAMPTLPGNIAGAAHTHKASR